MPLRIITNHFEEAIQSIHTLTHISAQADIKTRLSQMETDIQTRKDEAVFDYTRQFDKVSLTPDTLKVTSQEIQTAYQSVSPELIDALKIAIENVRRFHTEQLPKEWMKTPSPGCRYGMRYTPIEKAGLYVPGGRAVYPSTVIMNAIPAQVAGVPALVMVSPPRPDGTLPPQTLVAADLCGVTQIFKVGGAQAIFALAYGTQTLPKVDKIVGPGNLYVATAKQMVYGVVDIDKPAGPSEVLIAIEDIQYAAFAAADMLAQMEHDPDASAICISTSRAVLDAVQKEWDHQVTRCRRSDIIQAAAKHSLLIHAPSEDQVLSLINQIATEHLVLLRDDAEEMLPKIQHAGAIFLGPYTPVTLGDYLAGPNHVLPTGGAARFSSPLGTLDFMKFSTVLQYEKPALKEQSSYTRLLTETEGLDAHQHAVEVRLNE